MALPFPQDGRTTCLLPTRIVLISSYKRQLRSIRTGAPIFTHVALPGAPPTIVNFFKLHWYTFVRAMFGGSVVEGRDIADWTRTAVFHRWMKDRYVVDLYIWLQVHDQTMQPHGASFVTNKLLGAPPAGGRAGG
jgi:hypothetical protein